MFFPHLGLAKINEIDVVSQLVLQIFNHASNVLDVRVVHGIKRIPNQSHNQQNSFFLRQMLSYSPCAWRVRDPASSVLPVSLALVLIDSITVEVRLYTPVLPFS